MSVEETMPEKPTPSLLTEKKYGALANITPTRGVNQAALDRNTALTEIKAELEAKKLERRALLAQGHKTRRSRAMSKLNKDIIDLENQLKEVMGTQTTRRNR